MARKSRNNCTSEMKANDIVRWYIAIYIRLSKEDLRKKDESESITNQRKIILDFISENFLEDEYIVYDVYVDDGRTGTTEDTRPDYQRLTKDIAKGKVNCVIVKTLSRAFRNYADQGKFLEEYIPKYNCRFISCGGPFVDTYNEPEYVENMEVPINGLMNDRFAARTSSDVRKSFKIKRKNGDFIGAFAPYGYLKDPENKNHLIIDNEVANVVRDIFDWFLAGMTKMGIANELEKAGIDCPSEYKKRNGLKYNNPNSRFGRYMWSGRTVDIILHNEMYIGNMVQGRQKVKSYKVHKQVSTAKDEWFIVEGTHEPIIEKDVFENVQKLLQKDTRSAPGQKHVYPLSGFLRCSDCGKAIVRHSSKDFIYYKCSTYKNHSAACSSHSIREDKLFHAVLEAINTQIKLLTDMSSLIEEINSKPLIRRESIRLNESIKNKQLQLERIERYQKKLYESLIDKMISKERFNSLDKEYEEEKNAIKNEIEYLESEKELIQQGVTKEEPIFKSFLQFGCITELTREIVSTLIDNIIVYNDQTIEIHFKFKDQFKTILEYIETNRDRIEDKNIDDFIKSSGITA